MRNWEKLKLTLKKYYLNNRDKILIRQRLYYIEYKKDHKEQIKEKDLRYRNENKEKIKLKSKEYRMNNHLKVLLASAKQRAKKKNLEFSIKESDLSVPDYCPILNVKLESGIKSEYNPSIDRINNKLGYIPSNVKIISWRANRLKSDASAEELEAIAKYIRKYL